MRQLRLIGRASPLIVWLLIATGPLAAQQSQPDKVDKADKPVTDRDPSAVDVMATPVGDLNLRKGEIPPILLAAQNDTYSLSGLRRCSDLAAEVRRFDAVLGDDFDTAQAADRKLSAGKVAQSVVGSFIPFRGLIREISGANESERRLQYAIYAGSARRSFLKGVGLQRGCPWPARPASAAGIARDKAANGAEKDKPRTP
ncbi:hypothetical protein ACFOON_12015 [Novosphingobium piscinae]|uniref:Uncharacterized protein n=1 Tax=Novosphingobium piscinae TaxID=1507448 RepID=A0A7X1FW32_9SPHN|nr:hypothetical protein [Novosphingobium piscinae]MBC2668058.1 hypothetical protein [Novosphingobium piscinae]